MFLEKLSISSKNGIIRDIPFHLKGMNLIVNNTPSFLSEANTTHSGNNVGKTTFQRSIDFCFGASGKDIFKDKETGDNEEVKNFLYENEVIFILYIIKKDGTRMTLQRSFDSLLDLYIDGIKYDKLSTYNLRLNEIVFGLNDASKVTFRKIIKKFIRTDIYSESSIYKILGPFGTDEIYEALYLNLFGFADQDVIIQRLQATTYLRKNQNKLKQISGLSNLEKFKNKLIQLKKIIEEQEELIKDIDLPKAYEGLIEKLRNLKTKTANLSSEVGSYDIKISYSQKTKTELLLNKVKIDPISVKELYDEAVAILPNVQKKFEEVLDFHYKMVTNKLQFVEKHIAKLIAERETVKEELDFYLREQAEILRSLDNTGTFDDLLKIRETINNYYIERGKIEGQIEEIQGLMSNIKEGKMKLEEIDEIFNNYIAELKHNLENVFNKYFRKYTMATHDEVLYIYYDATNRKFNFDNIGRNVGDGYKKTDIISFDLAFISFFNELGLDFPRFMLHDKLEIIHPNQIKIVFEIANSLNGQFFVSVLKENVDFLGDEFMKNHKILELTQNDKFFRI